VIVEVEKSPLRCASVGTVAVTAPGALRSFVPWNEPKKNVRSRMMRPPKVAPYWLRLNGGTVVEKKFFAFRFSLRKN
jgi:hypothetical protein